MQPTINLCLVLHNHQPIGNFDGVFEQSYGESYLPFLEVFEPFEQLKIGLHISGPLMLWLDQRHPEYLDRLATLVTAGRLELLGGPFYEPILTMLPSRDRIGQIRGYSRWLQNRFGQSPTGMWMPERVWESQLTADLVPAGMRYTLLDDFHFRAAGLAEDQLHGYYLTEDNGHLLSILPGSERLRYLIPFGQPEETIAYARQQAERFPGSALIFGDDGEKFGTWPDTHAHCYERGWLVAFFRALSDNADWLHTVTPSQLLATTPPLGKIYLPDCSYREMTEWALPTEQQYRYEEAVHQLADLPNGDQINRFVRGGFWRNFKAKYSEANEMYCRMLEVSQRLQAARESGEAGDLLSAAEDHLYRGQCNCPYWHGAFGGIYLPHLRQATYHELITADNLLEQAVGRTEQAWVEASTQDYDLDGHSEVRLASESLIAYVSPNQGGMLYELDLRRPAMNLLASIARRPESYHHKITHAQHGEASATASIHDRVVCKQPGLEQRLQYDANVRKSMIDHFYDPDASLTAIERSEQLERGDFAQLPFQARIRRGSGKIQLQLTREGNVYGLPIRLTKAITLEAGKPELAVAYLIEGLPSDRTLLFATEWNFAGLPGGADDRFFSDADGRRLGHLGSRLDIDGCQQLGMTDQWLGVDVQLNINQPSQLWAFPIETVSQSEGGFELVHQSVCLMPHWLVRGDSQGRWSVQLDWTLGAPRVPHVTAEQEQHTLGSPLTTV